MEKTLQVTICLQCGDKGFANAFVYCVNCLDFAVHRYCLDKLPETLDEFIRWFCEDCKPKTVKQSPLRDSVSQQLSDACRKLESTELAITSPLKVKSETEKDNALLPPESNIELDLIEWAQLTEDCCSPIRVKLKNKKRRRRIKKKKKQVSRSVAETVEQRHLSSSALRPCEEFDLTLCAEVAGNSSPLKIEWRKSEDVSKSVAETEKLEHPNSPLLRVEESRKIGEEGESVRVDVSKSVAETEKLEHPNSPLLRVEERRKIGEEGESVRVDASQTVSGDISDMLVSCAQPIIDPIWRGSFSIHNKNDWMFDGIVAHLSNKACPQVCEEASLLPALVCPEMLPKSDVWPKRFEREEPNDDNIALYFFPENKRCEEGFDRLVGEMMCQELAMRAMVKNAELLVFPSTKLPELYWKFKGKYYLWGVFRSKQEASSDPADHQLNIPNGKNECFGHLNSRNDMDSADMRKITKANTWDTRSPLSPLSDNDSTSIALGTKITKHKWPEHPGQLEADLEDHPRLCPEHRHVSSINKNNENNHGNDNETLGPQVRDKLLERFRALQPESFAGVAEPWQAEQWLHQMDLIFETMECNDIEKRQLATFQLTYAAADWWDVVRGTIGEDAVRRMTWMSFKMKFLERYFPTMERNRKEWEFIDLIQGNMSVLEYTNQFERCSRFAPYMVDTTEKKIQKYTQGLIPSIRSWMIGHLNQPFETLVEMAINLEDYWINNRQFQHQTQQGPSPGKKLANNTQGQKRFRNGERKPNPAPQRNHPKSTKGQTDGPSGLCFNCGVPGHISKNCRAPKTKSRREVKCFNCGKLGHISRNCRAPRKNNNALPTQEQARVCAVFPNGAGVDEVKQYGLEGEHEHGRELNSDGR